MAGWISIDTKMRSHLGKSLALSLLIAGVWPMAALAEEMSVALTEPTDLSESIDADPTSSAGASPTVIASEITAAYISPSNELQLALDTTGAVTDSLFSPLPNPGDFADKPEVESSVVARSQPSPKTKEDQPVTDLPSQVPEGDSSLADAPPRTLAEAGWTSGLQVIVPQPTAHKTATEVLSPPLAESNPDAPSSPTSEIGPKTPVKIPETTSQTPSETESPTSTSENLGIPYFVDAEFRGSTRRQFGVLNLRLPVFQDEKSFAFADVHFEAGSNETFLGNLGLAYRRVLNTSEENPWVLGTYAFYDTTRSENGFQYHQGSLGAELVSKKFEFRVNGYLPGSNSNVVGQRTMNGVLGLQPRANGLGANVVQQTLTLEARERALAGFDFEVGHRHHFSDKVSLGLFGGYFFFDSSVINSIDGPMARAQLEVQDPLGMHGGLLQVGSRFRFDETRGSELEGFVRLGIPFGGPKRSEPLSLTQRLARRPIERHYEITTFAQDINRPITLTELQAAIADQGTLSPLGPQITASTSQVAINPATGQPINVLFVDGDGTAGDGTQGNPLTVAQVSTIAQPNDILFFLNDAGTIDTQTGPGNTLALLEGQQAFGVGTTPNFVLTVPNLGSLTIFDAGQPQLVNGANNNVLTLANNNTIDGLAFNGQNTAPRGIAAVTGATNTTIRNSSLSNFTVAGIQITPSTNTTIDNVVFNNNASDVIVNAANTTLTNVVSNNATGPAIQILNATGTTTLTNVDISNSGEDGLQFANPSGTITATNVDITNAGDNGIEITGGDGTFTFDATSSITNATNAAFNVVGGTTTLTYNGTITQNNPASAINITDKTGGTTTFNGFVTANTSTAPGVNLTNNTGSTITFNGGLDIDTTTGTGFNATNGGTVNVAASSGDESVTTTSGTALNLSNIAANITFDSVSSTGGTNGINLDTVTGSFGVSGTTTITNTTGDGFLATNSTGTYTFGPVTITNAGLDGVDLSGINDATTVFNLGALTINGFTGTGINLAGANVGVTASTVAITNTGNVGTGIDLTNTTGNRVITLGDPANVNGDTPSSIAGVSVGVQLNNANANFIFGDGELTVDAPSTIAATTPIDASAVGANGTYNFRDVAFAGSPGLGFTFPELFFVDQNTNGSGATITDPGSITAAEASPTADIFILVNTSGADVIDANNAGGTFDLTANQQILSFRNGSTINIPFAGPGNVLLNASTGSITDTTGNGAPTLTTTGAGTPATVAFANNNTINGVVLDNGSNGPAVSGTGLAGTATIQQSTLSTVDFNGGSVNVNITGSTLNNGNLLATVNVSGGHTGALTVDAATTINATNGTGLQFDNADGTYTFNGPITLNGGDAGIDILNGSGGTFTFANSAITNPTGIAYNEDTSTATVAYTGTLTQNNAVSAININNKTGGTTTFNGLVTANTSMATGVNLTNSSTVSFTGGLDIDTTTAVGFNATGSTVNVGAMGSTGTYTVTTTDSLAVNIADSTVDATFNSISATRSTSGSGITLNNLDGVFAVNGGTLSSLVGVDQNSFSIIQNDATATRNLTVAIDGISIIHDATTGIGNNDVGVFAETRDDDQLVLSIANSTFKTEDQGVVALGITEGLTVTNFSDNTLQGDATAFNPDFFANGFRFEGVVFDADPNTAGLQEVQGGTLTLGSPTERASFGFSALRNNVPRSSRGTIRFDQFNANVTNSAIFTDPSSADLTIRILDGSVDAGSIGLNQVNADITLSSLTLADSSGLQANQVTGSFTVTGTTSITAPERYQDVAPFGLVGPNIAEAIDISNSSANFTFNSINIAASTATAPANQPNSNGGSTVGIQLTGNTGTFTVTGTTTINTTVEDSIRISNNLGAVTFATTNLINPGAPIVLAGIPARTIDAAGIDIEGVNNGAIAFGNTSITNFGDDTGVDFAGSDPVGGVRFTSLNITGTGTAGSVGIDLSSTLNNRLIQVGDSMNPGADTPSSIANVEIGVELSSSQAVGTTANVNFIFGDGEDTVDQASTISVTAGGFTVQAIGLDPASGTYNFNDVTFTGNPNFPGGAGVTGQLFFVSDTGTGNGSSPTQAASVAAAQTQANLATVNTFVFINNGTTYNFDTLLAAAGNSFTLGTGDAIDGFGNGQTFGLQQPVNVLGTFPSTNITDPTGNGAAVLSTSAGNNVITLANNNTIQNVIFDGSSTAARAIAGLTGATNTTIQNTTIRNFTTGVEITPSTNTTVNNVTFSGNNADVIVNAEDTILSNITSTGTTGTAIQITNATGTTTLQNVSLAGGVDFTNASGTVNIDNLDINNATGIGVDISGGNATFDFDTASSISNPTGTAFNLNGGTASITYNGNITQANNASTVNVTGGHSTGTVTFQTGTLSASNGNGLQFNNADGTYNFNGTTTLNGGDAGIDILSGSTGTFTFSTNTSITSPTGPAFNLNASAATVTYNGTLSQANAARVVDIDDIQTGGVVNFTGSVSATGNSTGARIINSEGNVTFADLNLGLSSNRLVNNALTLTTNTGTYTFTDTDIFTNGGQGIVASTSGTLNIANMLIDTQQGLGINIQGSNLTGPTSGAFFSSVTVNNTTGGGVSLQNNTGTTTLQNVNITNTNGTGFLATTPGTLNITGTNNINTTTGTAVDVQNATIGTSNIVFNNVTSTNSTGDGINIVNLDAQTFSVTGTTTINGGVNGIDITNGSSATFSFASAIIDNTSGSGINLNGANGAVTFTTVDIDATTGVGLQIVSNTNAVNVNGGTIGATTTTTGNAVDIDSAQGSITVAANITNSAGRSIEVTNSGGTTANTISLTGAINETGLGIFLDNNDQNSGATINFSGGLTLGTTTNNAFTATNGGTVTVQGATNTITTTTGTALNVTNTSIGMIGAGPPTTFGLTFQSISANGATNGIVLNNAGTGGLQITGTGSTASSGGSIQNITNNGIQITNTDNIDLNNINLTGVATANSGTTGSVFGALNAISGYNAGIKLNTVNTIELNNLTIDGTETGAGVDNNNGEVGISGINVANLTLANVTVENFGNADGTGDGNEDNIQFQNLTGTVSVDTLITRDSGGGLFSIQNFAGAGALTMTVNNSTFGDTVMGVGRGGLEVETGATGVTTSVNVTNSNFGTGVTPTTAGALQGTAVSMDVNNGATGSLSVQNSTFNGANVAVSGTLDIGNGNLTVNVSNNSSITGIRSTGVNLFTNGSSTGTLSATIQNNTIGTVGSLASGSRIGSGIQVSNEGSGTTNVLIDNNTIQEVGDGAFSGFEGIFISESVSNGTLNVTVTNNAFANIRDDRALQSAITSGGTICSNISGNTFSGIIDGDNPFNASTRVIRLRQFGAGTHNTVQTSQLNLATVNSLSTTNINLTGTINFGQPACTLP